MTKLIKALVFASCAAHGPLHVTARLGFSPFTTGKLGFRSAPFSLTSGSAVQLYDFYIGERLLSPQARLLAYVTQNQPTVATRHLVDESELAFVELSSPVQPMLGDDVVNFNFIGEFVVKPLRAAGAPPKLLSGWVQSLINVREDLKERADALLAEWPANTPEADQRRKALGTIPSSPVPLPSTDDPEIRYAVEALYARRLSVEDMVRDLETLREQMRVPIAMKIFDFKYMPDGRPIDWPSGFKAQQFEVARRMNLPTLGTGRLVERYGFKTVMRDDASGAHFTTNAYPLLAELMYDFWARVLDRPFLQAYPEWVAARPALYEGLPPLFEGPARMAFPELMSFSNP